MIVLIQSFVKSKTIIQLTVLASVARSPAISLRRLDTVLNKLSCSLLDILIFRTVNFK